MGAAQADPALLERLIDDCASAGLALASRLLHDPAAAESVLQESVLAVWLELCAGSVDPEQCRARILAIVHRTAIDVLRRRVDFRAQRTVSPVLAMADEITPLPEFPAVSPAGLHAALARLPDGLRTVLELAFYEGLDYRQVAARLALPAPDAAHHMREALEQLQSLIGHDAERGYETAKGTGSA